jgi:hypothetical protein
LVILPSRSFSQIAPCLEGGRVGDRRYERACQQRPDAWDLHQPPAEFCLTRVCAKATVFFEDLFLYHGKLRRQHLQAKARFSWHTRISRICDYVGSERRQENRVARFAQMAALPIYPPCQ